jgi:drug/metabolite transporter (DMT)-like permease
MWTQRTSKDWTLLATLVVLWGSAFLMIKLAVTTIPPFTAVAVRLILALVILYLTMRLIGQRLPPFFSLSNNGLKLASPHWPYLILVGIAGNALPFSLIMWGQTRIDSGLAGILMAFTPLTTLLLSHFLIANERMTGWKTLGFTLGFFGICILIGPSAIDGLTRPGDFLYQLAVFGGAISYGLSTVLARKMPPLHPVSAGTGIALVGAILMTPIAVIVDRPWTIEPSLLSLSMVFLLGVFPTALANIVFFLLVKSAGATFVGLSYYLFPLWAVMMGVVFLDELPDLSMFLALIVILLGVGLSQIRSRNQ